MALTDSSKENIRRYVTTMINNVNAGTLPALSLYYEGCIAGGIDVVNQIEPYFAEELLNLKLKMIKK